MARVNARVRAQVARVERLLGALEALDESAARATALDAGHGGDDELLAIDDGVRRRAPGLDRIEATGTVAPRDVAAPAPVVGPSAPRHEGCGAAAGK
jgi:hypothetical protein